MLIHQSLADSFTFSNVPTMPFAHIFLQVPRCSDEGDAIAQ
jgi:hypothetical protein